MSKRAQMIVAAFVILVLAAIAIPNLLSPRMSMAQNACVNNLRWIQIAKNRWAEVYHRSPTDRPTESDLFSESNSIALSNGTAYPGDAFKRMPACPAGGTYIIGAINEEPRCSTGSAAHSLHPER